MSASNSMKKAPAIPPQSAFTPPLGSKPETDHRRQMLWQVWLPFGIGLLAILTICVLMVLLAVNGNSSLTRWSDISLIWLVALVFMPGMLVLVILAGGIYLLARLLRILPVYTHLVQAYAAYAAAWLHLKQDALMQPVIKVQSTYTGWQTLRHKLTFTRPKRG
jgi:FtsH-binding integral membrane protein